METTNRLYRTPNNAVLGGVCNGLSEYFKIDVTLVRIVFAVGTFATGGPFGILYFILWIALPKVDAIFNSYQTNDSFQPLTSNNTDMRKQKSRNLGGIILIVIGVIFLFDEFNFFWWLNFEHLWPLILVATGAYLIFKDKIDPDHDETDTNYKSA